MAKTQLPEGGMPGPDPDIDDIQAKEFRKNTDIEVDDKDKPPATAPPAAPLEVQLETLRAEREMLRIAYDNLENAFKQRLEDAHDAHAQFRLKVDRDWTVFRIVAGTVLTSVGVVAAAGIYAKYSGEQQVAAAIAEAKMHTDAMISASSAQVGGFQKQVNAFTEQMDGFIARHDAAANQHETAVATAGTVYDALGLLALGHRQLAEQNPRQAAYYAGQAIREVTAQTNKLPPGGDLHESLRRIRRPIWILQAESALQLGNTRDAEQIARFLLEDKCDCVEGNHFLGIALLDQATDERLDEKRRTELTESAIDALSQNEDTETRGNADVVLLAGAYFEKGNYHSARRTAEAFKDRFPDSKPKKSQLSERDKAYLTFSGAWMRLAAFALNGETEVAFPDDCLPGHGAIGTVEGRILERLFESAKVNRPQHKLSQPKLNAMAAFCNRAIQTVQHCATSPCTVIVEDSEEAVLPAPGPIEENNSQTETKE